MMNPESDLPATPSILIVDDDPDICMALTDLLLHEGYRVEAVGTGTQAIELARQQRYHGTLLDIGLPDVDGLTVLKSLLVQNPTLPVIVLTAFGKSENAVEALKRGAFAYLMKPYNGEELKATLRRALGVHALALRVEHAQSALLDSEERFRSVVESAPDAIILADRQGIIISWNKAAQTLFLYTREEIVGKPLTLIMPSRYRLAHEQGLERMRATGQSRVIGETLELHGLRKDNTEFPLELDLGTWTTQAGTFFSGIIRDITERKLAEESLRASMERFDLAIRGSREGLWDARIVAEDPFNPRNSIFYSTRFKELLGYQDHEFEGVIGSWASQLHPEDQALVFAALRDHLERSIPYEIEYRMFTKQGECRWFAARGQALWDETGRPVRMSGSFNDITRRKLAEEALRESQERFRQLAENIREVFWLTDPAKMQMLYISPGYEEIWGRTCESLYAEPKSWLDAIHPGDRARVLEAALTKQVLGTYDEEYRIVRPDGSIRWIRDRAFPIRDQAGTVYRLAGVADDITERRQGT
jgi:PAS domain S-box-containing protein